MIANHLLLFLPPFISCLRLVAADADASSKNNYQHYAITGVHTGVSAVSGARPVRRNILDMQEDSTTFALYIQALMTMQSTPESDLTSWYQIAGIHGRPYEPWDNVQQVQGAPDTGYCTHDSILFPTWHRPYLAGYEQILAGHCQTIAATYPASVRAKYVAAANNFRIPYWDWASIPQMPDVVNTPTITITTPYGAQTVANPLFSYKFQTFPLNKEYFPTTQSGGNYDWYLALDNQTYRNPLDETGGPSNYAGANMVLAKDQLQSRTYYAMTKSTTYNNFATQSLWGPSIEGIHGSVHVDIGGAFGHMSELSYAAFDPIFWLHHCNVDRIVALYQAMFPASQNASYYVEPAEDYYGTYTLLPDRIENLDTPLEPFSTDTAGDFWTSRSSQYLSTFGYTYPEIQDWNKTPSQLAANVTAQVNMMWNQQTMPSPSKRAVTTDGYEHVIEWSVALSISKFEMNGQRFIVRLFLGNIPADPMTWATSESCVGSFAVLPPPQVPTGSLPNVKAYDEVSLVQALSSVGHDGQDVQTVVEYLTENFEWRVQLMDGTVVATDQYQSLDIVVQEETVTLASNIYEIPSYGAKTLHPEITRGKPGGY